MGKQFHQWLIEPMADQKWDSEKEIQIKLSNSYFLSGCFVPGTRDTVENKTIPSVSRTTQTGSDTMVQSVLCDVKEYLAQPWIRGGFWEKLSEGWVARKVGRPGRKSGTSEERKRPFCLEYSFMSSFWSGFLSVGKACMWPESLFTTVPIVKREPVEKFVNRQNLESLEHGVVRSFVLVCMTPGEGLKRSFLVQPGG